MRIKPAKACGGVVVELAANDPVCLATTAEMPFVLKNVLVPIDFSDCSQRAVRYAILFAQHFGARLTFLHVLTMDSLRAMDFEPLGSDLCFAAKKRLLAISQEEAAHIPTQVDVRWGAPSQEIISAADTADADLIIMSTHGHTGRVHAFLGSVAADVTRLAHCPVLVVRGGKSNPSAVESNHFEKAETPEVNHPL